MKAKSSPYIRAVRPLLEKLLADLKQRYPYASVLASDCREKIYRVNRRLSDINGSGMLSARGFVVKVFDGTYWSEHSFNEITEDTIPDILRQIAETSAISEGAFPEGIGQNEYTLPEEEETVFQGSTECVKDPEETDDDEILARMEEIRDRGLAFSEKILDCIVQINWNHTSKLFLSPKKDLEQNILWTTGMTVAAAAKGQEIKSSFRTASLLGGMEIMDQLDADMEKAAGTTLELLDSLPIEAGEYDCVCDPEVTGMIVHEAFGHGVEMDMFVKKRALAEKYIGRYVASPLVTMHDGAAALAQTGTYFFDDEGIMAHDTVVIDRGILRTGISDYQSARILGTEPTGNGRRESYRRKAYTRMTNTWFEGGTDSVEDMIASIDYGFLLEEPSSGMEDPKNWGIQCMVSIAREIRDGRLTGRIFSPIVLTGYVPDLLKSISMMSPDPQLSGSGFCGKGYKEWVKVSDGGPYIKARIRLG